MQRLIAIAGIFAALAAAPVSAASTVVLPAWVCDTPDTIFRSGFEEEVIVPHDPSNGSGGAATSDQTLVVAVPGFGNHSYQLHLPTGYTPSRPWPLLIALHGAGGPGTAPAAAAAVRDEWAPIADANGFVVAAPVASGGSGGWTAPANGADVPTDYEAIAAVRDDVEAKFNVERTRRYLWGYSAGGHIAHDLVQNGWAGFDASTVAAYAVSAGALSAVTCDVTQPQIYSRPTCNALLGSQPRRAHVLLRIGNSDSPTLITQVQTDRNRFTANGWVLNTNVFYTTFVGGHVYAGTLAPVWPKLCPVAVVVP